MGGGLRFLDLTFDQDCNLGPDHAPAPSYLNCISWPNLLLMDRRLLKTTPLNVSFSFQRYEVMRQCWVEPERRPGSRDLESTLMSLMSNQSVPCLTAGKANRAMEAGDDSRVTSQPVAVVHPLRPDDVPVTQIFGETPPPVTYIGAIDEPQPSDVSAGENKASDLVVMPGEVTRRKGSILRQANSKVCWSAFCMADPGPRKAFLVEGAFTPKLKGTFSQPSKEKCISGAVRIGSIIIFHLSKLWKAMFFLLCNISGEAAGEICNWSLLGVKGLTWTCEHSETRKVHRERHARPGKVSNLSPLNALKSLQMSWFVRVSSSGMGFVRKQIQWSSGKKNTLVTELLKCWGLAAPQAGITVLHLRPTPYHYDASLLAGSLRLGPTGHFRPGRALLCCVQLL